MDEQKVNKIFLRFFFFTGDSRLVFIWPQKASKSRLSNVLAPLLRGVLIGLLFVDALHLWPGEFLPTSLPSNMPISLPPVKCNVIEPRWFDNNWVTIGFVIVYYKHLYSFIAIRFLVNCTTYDIFNKDKIILLCKLVWFRNCVMAGKRFDNKEAPDGKFDENESVLAICTWTIIRHRPADTVLHWEIPDFVIVMKALN